MSSRKSSLSPAAVRAAYIEERQRFDSRISRGGQPPYRPSPRWDGGRDRSGRLYKPVWPSVSDKLAAAGITDVRDYMRWVFAQTKVSAAVYPNMLAASNLTSRYLQERVSGRDAVLEDEIIEAYRAQSDLFLRKMRSLIDADFARSWSTQEREEYILFDLKIELSALFRYLLGKQLGLERVVERFRDAAKEQYQRSPEAYKKHWSNLIGAARG